jgi:hypothetical protein
MRVFMPDINTPLVQFRAYLGSQNDHIGSHIV